MGGEGATDESDRGSPGTPPLQSLDTSLDNLRMVRKTKVIV